MVCTAEAALDGIGRAMATSDHALAAASPATALLPGWTIWVIALGTPVSALLGVLIGNWANRKGSADLETRSKREETLRTLRWAAELAVSEDDRAAELGVAQLTALLESDLLDDKEKVFVEAALDTVYEDPEEELEQLGEDEVEVVVEPDDEGLSYAPSAEVALGQDPSKELR